MALDPAVADDHVGGVQGLHLQEVCVVDDLLDDLAHVVRLVGGIGDERIQGEVVVVEFQLLLVLQHRGLGEVVGGQEVQQFADELDRVGLVGGQVGGRARGGVVLPGAAEGLHVHVLAGDGLDDVGAGDEHVRGLVHHHHVVGQGGGVGGAAGARAHDEGDLGDHAGGMDVVAEDVREHGQRGDAFLDAGAAAVVDAHHRAAVAQREFLDLDDLLAVDLAERAAVDGEVLAVDGDGAAVHGAVAGHHAVAQGLLLLHAEGRGAVHGQGVELHEGSLVDEQVDAFAGGVLAAGMLLLDGFGAGGLLCTGLAVAEIGDLSRCRCQIVAHEVSPAL